MLSKCQSVAPFYHGIYRQPQPIDISIGTRRVRQAPNLGFDTPNGPAD